MFQAAKKWTADAVEWTGNKLRAGKAEVVAAGTATLVAANEASYAATDYSSLTSSVDFSGVTTAVLGVFGSLAAVYVAILGGSIIISKVKGR